jgi:predicted ATPase
VTIRLILPFFGDFVLLPAADTVFLQWREQQSDMLFGAHQASDGMLRVLALVTLLLQPSAQQPSVIILDEPELGLHPYAINVIAGLIQSVALERQVILATQSMALIDHFSAEQIVVVDRPERETLFHRLDPVALTEWLAEYSLSELWEKNVLGGRPGR